MILLLGMFTARLRAARGIRSAPGYLGSTLGFREEIAAQPRKRLKLEMLIVAVGVALWLPRRAAALNARLLGESEASHLGIDVERLKRELVFCTALGVGAAVAAATDENIKFGNSSMLIENQRCCCASTFLIYQAAL